MRTLHSKTKGQVLKRTLEDVIKEDLTKNHNALCNVLEAAILLTPTNHVIDLHRDGRSHLAYSSLVIVYNCYVDIKIDNYETNAGLLLLMGRGMLCSPATRECITLWRQVKSHSLSCLNLLNHYMCTTCF